MPTLNIYIPDALRAEMNQFQESNPVNWSKVAQDAIIQRIKYPPMKPMTGIQIMADTLTKDSPCRT